MSVQDRLSQPPPDGGCKGGTEDGAEESYIGTSNDNLGGWLDDELRGSCKGGGESRPVPFQYHIGRSYQDVYNYTATSAAVVLVGYFQNA